MNPPAGGDADEMMRRILAKQKRLLLDGPKRYDDPQAAMDFFLQQRLPAGSNLLPLETLRAARGQITQRLERKRAAASRAGRALEGWTELGPPNIGGRTRAIVINPDNPDIMFAGSASGAQACAHACCHGQKSTRRRLQEARCRRCDRDERVC